jgi:hypothetical protein
MATRTLSGPLSEAFRRARLTRATSEPPLVRKRKAVAAALLAGTVALGVLLVVLLGPAVLAVLLPPLPMAFILLWGSTDALRFDEHGDEELASAKGAPDEPRVDEAPSPAAG